MAPKKAKNKYAPSQEFLDSCYEKGTRAGTATGKAEKAATAAVKKISKSALNLASDAATQVQERLAQGIHKVMGSDEYKKKALDVNARLTNALASVEDSIKRRDIEIAQLRLRVSELERQLLEGSS